jgi:molecular chaperone GrpE
MEKTDGERPALTPDEQFAGQESIASAQQSAVQELQKAEEKTEEMATLLTQLQEKEAEAKANYDLFLRERAELENFKRRMQRERAESLRFANEPLLRDLLPAIDNLERAIDHAQGGGNGAPLVDGVSLVFRSLLDILEKHGVHRVSAKGQPFDPNQHEAMAQVESAELAPNMVVDEHHAGYVLHGRLLRPALVTVAKAPVIEPEAAVSGVEDDKKYEK